MLPKPYQPRPGSQKLLWQSLPKANTNNLAPVKVLNEGYSQNSNFVVCIQGLCRLTHNFYMEKSHQIWNSVQMQIRSCSQSQSRNDFGTGQSETLLIQSKKAQTIK